MIIFPLILLFMIILLSFKILLSKSFITVVLSLEFMSFLLFMYFSMNFSYFLLNQQIIMLVILVTESVLGMCLMIAIGRSGSSSIKLSNIAF